MIGDTRVRRGDREGEVELQVDQASVVRQVQVIAD